MHVLGTACRYRKLTVDYCILYIYIYIYIYNRTSKKNLDGRTRSSHDKKKFRSGPVEKQRGMAFGLRKTATAVEKNGCMDGWMDGWKEGWMDGWMDGWSDGRMGGWLDRRMDGWKDGWMYGWMDRRKNGGTDGWKDGWMDG